MSTNTLLRRDSSLILERESVLEKPKRPETDIQSISNFTGIRLANLRNMSEITSLLIPSVPKKTVELSGGYCVEVFTSKEITPMLVQEVSDFYRYTFNNNGHYLVYPTTFEFISPQEVFGRESNIDLHAMDSLIEFPTHPKTGEKAIFWHHPEGTRQLLTEKLMSDGHLSVLRGEKGEMQGFTFGHSTTVEKQFDLEAWRNPFQYAGIELTEHNRDISDFLQRINSHLSRQDEPLNPKSQIYSWNTVATSPEARGLKFLLPITKEFFDSITQKDRVVISEAKIGSTAYQMFQAAGYCDIPGILSPNHENNDSTIIIASLKGVADFFSLSQKDFSHRIMDLKRQLKHAA